MTATPTRWRFLIDAHAASDALVRVLTPFAVVDADLVDVAVSRDGCGMAIRVEAEGLDTRRAETLLRRLEALPVVDRVGLGWSAAAPA